MTWPKNYKYKYKDKDKDIDILRTPPKSNPRDLWHLRHWLQFWQLRTWIHDNLCDLTINCDTGQLSQFLRCFLVIPLSMKFIRLWEDSLHQCIAEHSTNSYWISTSCMVIGHSHKIQVDKVPIKFRFRWNASGCGKISLRQCIAEHSTNSYWISTSCMVIGHSHKNKLTNFQ